MGSAYDLTGLLSIVTGPIVPSTIPSQCCAIPFTYNGDVHYKCTAYGNGVGCYYGNRQWKLCQQPAGNNIQAGRRIGSRATKI